MVKHADLMVKPYSRRGMVSRSVSDAGGELNLSAEVLDTIADVLQAGALRGASRIKAPDRRQRCGRPAFPGHGAIGA